MPPPAAKKRAASLSPFLQVLSTRYHHPDYLGSDPLVEVRRFKSPVDREIAALFAALLAYGNVKQINASLRKLYDAMRGHPAPFVAGFDPARDPAALKGFKHRFTDSEDIACLCHLLAQALAKCATLENFFLQGYDPAEPDLVGAATRFMENLCSLEFAPRFSRDRMLRKTSFKHLMPRADKGSACKRVHLFLRWMIRPDDGIDLGLWHAIPASKLIMPVDTHILRIGRNLGILRRKTGSLAAAREITAMLALCDSADPVRFDFPLCRLGILQKCPTTSNLAACDVCELNSVCEKRRKLATTRNRLDAKSLMRRKSAK
ncbi:MAG: TIGR02757 family protein [Candidatus Sumerlaeaceae bacterium]|nr:TIGR02757 family protein [Candidatus Sumerlaeaceae bacterium]